MNHIDEGSIHAWLDGALDAARASEVESHVAGCETCSAAVAEARGLIAGSSRILIALDDVPAGVVPKRAPPPAMKRQWRAAPWVTGIAAALILAVGITTWRRVPVPEPSRAVVRAVQADSLPTAPASVTGSGESTVGRGLTQPLPEPVTATSAPSRDARQLAARPGRAENARESVPTPTPPAAPPPEAQSAAVAADESRPEISQRAQGLAAGVQPRPTARLDFGAEALGVAKAAAAAPVEVETVAGCYLAQAVTPSSSRAAGGGAVERASVRRQATAPSAAAVSDLAANRPSIMIRLDTTRGPGGYAVRSTTGDSTIGWWNRIGRDSARVQFLAGAVMNLERSSRVACPNP